MLRSFARGGPRLALALLAVVLSGGTSGYVLIEGWDLWDAFYMTVTTVATVGFREVHPLSGAGQAFTVLLIFGGVGTAFYTATLLATVIAAVGTDAENVYAVLTARVMRPDLFIIARAESDEAGTRLVRAGADRVISPYHIGATHMAQTALRPAVVDFVQLATSSEELALSMEQVRVAAASSLVGKTIVEAGIRQKFGVIIVAIKRSEGTMEFNPPPEAVIRSGDELVVLGRPQD